MNSPRFFITLFSIGAMISLMSPSSSAQYSPTTFEYAIASETVTAGTYPFANTGSVNIVYTQGKWASYAATGDIAPNGLGTYSYAQTGPNTGVLTTTRQDITPAFSAVFNLTFTSPTSGSVYATGTYDGVAGSAAGDFTVILLQPVTPPPPAALVEIYEISAEATSTHRLANISTRGGIGIGSDVFTAGFVISGTASETVLIRAVGPTLALFGVNGAAQNPTLTLYDSSSKVVATAGPWGSGPTLGPSTIRSTIQLATAEQMASVGAFALPIGSADSALVATLPPGNYTVSVGGN